MITGTAWRANPDEDAVRRDEVIETGQQRQLGIALQKPRHIKLTM